MRAFMSRRDDRDERTVNAGTMGDLGVAWNAEREARAILAETDIGEACSVAFFRPLQHRDAAVGCIECRAGFALAESLAAFIEQEF